MQMEGQLVAVGVIGKDRPGIVAAVTQALYELNCNLEDATSTILRGHFTMMLIVRASHDVSAGRLQERMRRVAEETGLVITTTGVEEIDLRPVVPTHSLAVYGSDRPGIVYRVADLLASKGVNITDLQSRVIGPEAAPVYALLVEVSVPTGTELRADLEALKAELGVDMTYKRIEADIL